MALNTSGLETAIQAAFAAQTSKTENPDDALGDLATKLAAAIEAFVKSGTVTVAANIAVSTSGSPSAQTGFTTSTGTGTIS